MNSILATPCSSLKAMKNLSLAPPYHPQVRSNRDLANFYCNSEAARHLTVNLGLGDGSNMRLHGVIIWVCILMRLDDSFLIEMPVSTLSSCWGKPVHGHCTWIWRLDWMTVSCSSGAKDSRKNPPFFLMSWVSTDVFLVSLFKRLDWKLC